MGKKIYYWDSDTFLAMINEDKTLNEMQGCCDIWTACLKGEVHLVTSTLTTVEVIHKKGVPKLSLLSREKVSNFFRNEFISQKSLTREITELARDVVWDSNIQPKDAVHVATCAYFRVGELHTFDKALTIRGKINVKGFQFVVNNPRYPHTSSQLNLFPP